MLGAKAGARKPSQTFKVGSSPKESKKSGMGL